MILVHTVISICIKKQVILGYDTQIKTKILVFTKKRRVHAKGNDVERKIDRDFFEKIAIIAY